jgi:hypothetical protein
LLLSCIFLPSIEQLITKAEAGEAPTTGFNQKTLLSYLQHLTDEDLSLVYTETNAEGEEENVEQPGRGCKFPAADKVPKMHRNQFSYR